MRAHLALGLGKEDGAKGVLNLGELTGWTGDKGQRLGASLRGAREADDGRVGEEGSVGKRVGGWERVRGDDAYKRGRRDQGGEEGQKGNVEHGGQGTSGEMCDTTWRPLHILSQGARAWQSSAAASTTSGRARGEATSATDLLARLIGP